ncbi:MAG TPA: LysE family translocator [Kiloniellales bacterium]
MPGAEALLIFTAAALVLNLSPGPSNLYVLSRSLAQGTRAGLIAAAGLAAGSLGHVAAAALGLSAVFLYSPVAYALLKLAGAGYLIYLGLTHLVSARPAAGAVGAATAKPRRTIFLESSLVELLNPKTALFFLAFLPQFADVAAGPLAPQLLLLGLIVTLTALPCDAAVAVLSGRAARILSVSPLIGRLQSWVSGSILIGLGAFLALGRRATD